MKFGQTGQAFSMPSSRGVCLFVLFSVVIVHPSFSILIFSPSIEKHQHYKRQHNQITHVNNNAMLLNPFSLYFTKTNKQTNEPKSRISYANSHRKMSVPTIDLFIASVPQPSCPPSYPATPTDRHWCGWVKHRRWLR